MIGVASETQFSVRVTWSAPVDDGGAALTGYVVRYIAVSDAGASWQETPTLDAASLTTVVDALSPLTTYWFQVAAVNSQGQGAWSGEGVFTTEIPTGEPEKPAVSTFSSRHAVFSWQPPAPIDGIVFTAYSVYLDADDGQGWILVATVPATTTTYTITGLLPRRTYKFGVASHNTTATARRLADRQAMPAPVDGSRRLADNTGPISQPVVVTTNDDDNELTYQGSSGTLQSDDLAPGSYYAANANRTWRIVGSSGTNRLDLTFTSFDVECDHDFVSVVSDDGSRTALWTGGCYRPGPFTVSVSTTTGSVLVKLRADATVQRPGFALSFAASQDAGSGDPPPIVTDAACPASSTLGLCAGAARGSCNNVGDCVCNTGWTGEDCSAPVVCPSSPTLEAASPPIQPLCASSTRLLSLMVVAPNGNDTSATEVADGLTQGWVGNPVPQSNQGSVPKPFATLRAAVSAALGMGATPSGDPRVILVHPGVYGAQSCGLVLSGSASTGNVVIRSLAGAASTTINCGFADRFATFRTGDTSSVSGLGIQHASAAPTATDVPAAVSAAGFADATHGAGGALLVYGAASPSLSAMVVSHSLAGWGGAAVVVGAGSALSLSSCEFTLNNATHGGGAVAAGAGAVVTSDGGSKLTANVVLSSTGRGGGVFCATCSFTGSHEALPGATDVVVRNNEAWLGGGVFLSQGSVANVTIESNRAARGAGMYVVACVARIVIGWPSVSHHSFRVFTARYVFGASNAVSGSVLQSNAATRSGGGLAVAEHAILVAGGERPLLSPVSIVANTAPSGGGVHLIGLGSVLRGDGVLASTAASASDPYATAGMPVAATGRDTGLNITMNAASYGGGGMWLGPGACATTVHVYGNTADGLQGGGGVVLESHAAVLVPPLLHASVVHGNMADGASPSGRGGGVRIVGNSTAVITGGTTIVGNFADVGGGVFADTHTSVSGSIAPEHFIARGDTHQFFNVSSCEAAVAGGGITLSFGTRVSDAHVDSCSSQSGGGVYVLPGNAVAGPASTSAPATLAASTVQSCTSTAAGGGVYVDTASLLHVESTRVEDCIAGTHGGGIAIATGATVRGTSAPCISNTASQLGGGVWCDACAAVVDLHIVANTAAQGGGVAVVGGTAVALSRIVVEGNSASTRAGGLLVRGNTVVVSAGNDALVVENRVTDTTACGGGVAVDMGAVLLHDGSVAVTNNTATSGTASGGGLCIDAAVVRAPAGAPSHWRLRVHGNEGVRGGGVAMAGVATLEQASVAWGVASQRAGGVDVVSGADATLTSVEVADCRAVTSGGGIAVTNSQLSVMDVQVLRCAAGTSGGGALFDGATLTATASAPLAAPAASAGDAFRGLEQQVLHAGGSGLVLQQNLAPNGGGAFVTGPCTLAGPVAAARHGEDGGVTSGGCVMMQDAVATLTDWVMLDCVAEQGGGVFIEGASSATMSHVAIDAASATAGDGGAMFVDTSLSATVASSVFTNCTASLAGGAVASTSAFSCTDCSFVENSAPLSGGAISVSGNSCPHRPLCRSYVIVGTNVGVLALVAARIDREAAISTLVVCASSSHGLFAPALRVWRPIRIRLCDD